METDMVRVVRVLEYTGPREQVEKTTLNNHIKGSMCIGSMVIREAILGDFPETIGGIKIDTMTSGLTGKGMV